MSPHTRSKRVRSPEADDEQNKRNVKHTRTPNPSDHGESNQQPNEEANPIVFDEDEEDIPYTHNNSRSTTPLSDLSQSAEEDQTVQIMRESRTDSREPRIDQEEEPPIEVVDVDDELKEYYVISEDEEKDDNEIVGTQKTVEEQLLDTSRQNPSNPKNATCAVCFDTPESTYILPCGHLYCGDCAFRALSSTKQSTGYGGPCSLCRAYTPYNKVTVAIFKKKRKVLT